VLVAIAHDKLLEGGGLKALRTLEEGGALQLGDRGIVVKDMGVPERLEEAD
jgi:hypothetical protein